MVGLDGNEDNPSGCSSRVRFLDATTTQKEFLYRNPTRLPELSTPKTTAVEFYMVCPGEGAFYNYDYSVTYEEDNEIGTRLDDSKVKLRGRKFYWHSRVIATEPENSHNNMHRKATIQPLNTNVKFSFDMIFENLTDDELSQLVWVLTFGRYWKQDDSENYAHKLGHGKPLGYGSVKIDVTGIDLISLDTKTLQLQVSQQHKPDPWDPFKNLGEEDSVPLQEYLAISEFEDRPDKLVYPLGKKKDKPPTVYDWFVGNKGLTIKQPKIVRTLPLPTEPTDPPDHSLPGFKEV
jgi:CRISPR-associated protein (TIGR03986 family)